MKVNVLKDGTIRYGKWTFAPLEEEGPRYRLKGSGKIIILTTHGGRSGDSQCDAYFGTIGGVGPQFISGAVLALDCERA